MTVILLSNHLLELLNVDPCIQLSLALPHSPSGKGRQWGYPEPCLTSSSTPSLSGSMTLKHKVGSSVHIQTKSFLLYSTMVQDLSAWESFYLLSVCLNLCVFWSAAYMTSWQVSSLNESIVNQIMALKPAQLVRLNQRQLLRVYPSNYRVDSSNFNPQPFWNAGCHMGKIPCSCNIFKRTLLCLQRKTKSRGKYLDFSLVQNSGRTLKCVSYLVLSFQLHWITRQRAACLNWTEPSSQPMATVDTYWSPGAWTKVGTIRKHG